MSQTQQAKEYLLIPRMEIQCANAKGAFWLVNAAPIFAAAMFAHNLGRHTGSYPTGIGILHHHGEILGENGKDGVSFQQRRGAVSIGDKDYVKPKAGEKAVPQLSLQSTASCHLIWSLLLEFDALPSAQEPERFLSSARLGGGQIIKHGRLQAVEGGDEAKALALTQSGYWIVERQDLMESGGDPLDALIRATSHTPDGEGGEAENWVFPATLGYAAITGFEHRTNVREGYRHAFAEPLVGLAQYVPVRTYDGPLPLWRHRWLRDDVFIVTQH